MPRVQSVTGNASPEELGITLPHEHLLFDLSCYYVAPPAATNKQLAEAPVSIRNLGEIHRNPFAVKQNLLSFDVELLIKELSYYRRAGGGALVDMSNHGLARDPAALRAISIATGVKIIAGSGYYVAASHPPRVKTMSIDDIAAEITGDVQHGMDGTGIRAGIIGEIGTSRELAADEVKVLRGAARAQAKTGASLNIHPFCGWPGPWAMAAHKLLDVVEEEGGDLSRVVLSHMDSNGFVDSEHISLAKRGAYIEYDTFGQEHYYSATEWDPRDTERVSGVASMVKKGYSSKLLISQDVCFLDCFREYGGYGYDHILRNIIPMLRSKGVDQRTIDEIMIENPKKVLTIE